MARNDGVADRSAANGPAEQQVRPSRGLVLIISGLLVVGVVVFAVVWLVFFKGPAPGSVDAMRQALAPLEKQADPVAQADALAAYHRAWNDFYDSTDYMDYREQQDHYTGLLISTLARAWETGAFSHEEVQVELDDAIDLMKPHCPACAERLRLAKADL